MLDSLIIIILVVGIPNLAIVIFNTNLKGRFPYLSAAGLDHPGIFPDIPE